MKAIVQTGYGEPERVLRLQEVERPPVGADDVMVGVRAASVNTPDLIVVAREGRDHGLSRRERIHP